MKTGILTTKTIASDDIKDTKSIMGMSAKGMEMAQYFLRDKIYSNKVLAVVREYISNAYDEHKKYNIDRDIDVSIKSENSQWVWSVRDYAMGLNEHDIRNIFGVYFESTKSHENNSIGGFGIGGKAGFSYTDTFYVNSHHNGVKSTYVCTLGSGTKGIPVGEIYKISEEPTTAQGIEISLEMDKYDVSEFVRTTKKFVEFFSPDAKIRFTNGYVAYLDSDGGVFTPTQPINTVDVDEYRFSSYENAPHSSNGRSTYYVRMGGVIYPHNASSTIQRSFSKNVVVDVPIGKLSIPISRESIETTPLNDKVFSEIEKCLDSISEDEIKTLTAPKFGSLTTGNETFGRSFEGEWFLHSFKDSFPKSYKMYYKTGRILHAPESTTLVVSKGPKHIVYIVPGIKSVRNWHKRLIESLKKVYGDDYCGYAFISKPCYDEMMAELDDTIDISDCAFVDVKTLKLPKLHKESIDKTSYQVFERYGYKKSYTAEELDKKITDIHFAGVDPEDDWYLEVESIDTLHNRTIGLVSDFGTRCNFITANSTKMVNALKELGWLTPSCPEYIDIVRKLKVQTDKQRLIDGVESRVISVYYGNKCNERVLKHLGENPEKVRKLEIVKEKILNENTTRSRILNTFRDYSRKVNRNDLRRILMMKD